MTAPTPPSAPPPGWTPPPLGWTAPPQQWTPPPAQTADGWLPPTDWPAPGGGLAVPPGPPAPDRRRSRLVVTAVIVAVVLVAGLAAVWALGSGAPAPQPSPSAPTAPVGVDGGDIGKAVTLGGPDGTGTVTTTAAIWTPEGDVPPEDGMSYLIVDVEITGESGEIEVGGLFTVAVAADAHRYAIAYGPVLIPALPSARLGQGDSVAGQVGFQVPVGETRIEFQDPDGTVLGSITVPGP